jgi:hypothetical protein
MEPVENVVNNLKRWNRTEKYSLHFAQVGNGAHLATPYVLLGNIL